ncbi:MAG: Uma2 family endonuclease [Leptolyngbyaceae cyanobacterium]
MNTLTTVAPPLSLADFLAFDDGTDAFYELENGDLLAMPPESDLNQRIASFIFAYLLQLGILPQYLRMKTEIVVSGSGTTVRVPDLLVLSDGLATAMAGATRSTIMPDMPPPSLVVEVVSPGKKNADRDYRYKRAQYQARGIEEYWIVDPIAQQVTVLVLVDGLYEESVFKGEEAIASPFIHQFNPTSAVTVTQVL